MDVILQVELILIRTFSHHSGHAVKNAGREHQKYLLHHEQRGVLGSPDTTECPATDGHNGEQ